MGDAAKIRAKRIRKKTDSNLPFDPAIVICGAVCAARQDW